MLDINWKPAPKQLRNFAVIGIVFFGGIGAWVFLTSKLFVELAPGTARGVAIGLWALCAWCAVAAVVSPPIARPLYVAMTAVTLPIGFVLSHVILALIFYGMMTPVGLFFRLIGRDALCRRFEPQRASYWIPRRQPADKKRYFRQF